MADTDRIEIQRSVARQQLNAWRAAPLALERPVYFVPGWTDEQGKCWARMEPWVRAVCANHGTHAHFIQFESDAGSGPPPWEDFIRFGADLAKVVNADLAAGMTELDVVCHSMGGLDAFAAIALLDDYPELGTMPVKGVVNVITLDTPFRGFAAAGNKLFQMLAAARRKSDPHVLSQLLAMQVDSLRILEVWQRRNEFLGAVQAFWPRGADNTGGLIEVPHESASFGDPEDFEPALRPRDRGYRSWEDTSHSGVAVGVTNDLRVIVEVLQILTGA